MCVRALRMDEFRYPPRRMFLPLLQSGAIFYSYPGFRYAPPWAEVYRHSVARLRPHNCGTLCYSKLRLFNSPSVHAPPRDTGH